MSGTGAGARPFLRARWLEFGAGRPVIDRASATDLAFLAMDTGPVPQQIAAVLVLDAGAEFDPSRAGELVAQRISAVPRLRQRLVRVPPGCGRAIWIDDAHFDVRRHVRQVRCRDPGDERALLDLAAAVVTEPLPRGRPLWSAVFITGLAGNRVALVIVVHHVLVDGIGGLAVLANLIEHAASQQAGPPTPAGRSRGHDPATGPGRVASRCRDPPAPGGPGAAGSERWRGRGVVTDSTIRPRRDPLRWRATPEERRMRLPGDELVPAPLLQITRAVMIDVPPQQVWPWLVQTGQGRAGFYSDSPFWDRCVDWYYRRLAREQPGTAEVGYQVATDDRVVSSWQNLRVGDVIADGPPGTAYYVVRQAEPDRVFVLFTDTHLPHLLPARLRNNPRLRIYGELSDAVVLSEVKQGRTRLVRRMRMTCGPWPFRLLAVPIVLAWGDWITERNFLRGVKQRAERTARESPLPAIRPEFVLDRYLPKFDVRERQARLLYADVGAVQAAIGQTDLTGIPVVRTFLVLRALPGRLRARLGARATPVPPPFTLADMPRAGWTSLAEGPEEVGFGTLTHPWRIGNEAPLVVDRETFAAFCTPGYAKVAFSIRADPDGPHRTRVTTETRVATTDPRSRRRFAAYWVVVGPLSGLIRRLVLRRLAIQVEHE